MSTFYIVKTLQSRVSEVCLLAFALCALSNQRPFQASERWLNIRLGNIERLLDHVLKRMDRGVERDTRLVTRAGSKLYSVKKPCLERTRAGGGMDRVN